MSKVLLVNLRSAFLLSPSAILPSLGTLYIASALESRGHTAVIVDLDNTHPPLTGHNPDFIGISATTPHVAILRPIMRDLRNWYQGVPIVLGGPHFTARPDDAVTLGADCVCVGDGEQAMLDALEGRRGTLQHLIDVDEWPFPARHLIDLDNYTYKMADRPATSMVTSRGCPYTCAYCSRGVGADILRSRSLDLVDEEIESIKRLGIDGIVLYDDEVNLSTKRLRDLCSVFAGHHIRWRAFVRSNLFTAEQARAMADSGCWEVCSGVESGSDEILKLVGKRATVADATRARRLTAEAGMRFKAFTLIGLPGETEATAALTKEWLLRERPDSFDICPFTPYPGSDMANYPERYDIVIERSYWDESYYHKGRLGQYHICARTAALSSERIAELRDEIEREVKEALA